MKPLGSVALLGIGVAAVAVVGLWLGSPPSEAEAPSGPPPFFLPVTLAGVEQRDLAPTVRITGTVRAPRHARLGFDVTGRIRSLEVREGDTVAAGAVLARLWDLDQQAALRRAEAAADLARRRLDGVLAGAREEEIRRLQAELVAREAEAELARNEVERNRELAGSSVISSSRFDTLVSAGAAAAARVAAAEERLAEAQAGTRLEDIAIARAEVGLQEAEVGMAEREVDKTILRAPFGGSVVARLGAEGNTLALGQPLVELVDLSDREIELEISGSVALRVGERPSLRVTLDGRPDFALEAHLDSLVVVADEDSRNFRGLVRIAREHDPEQLLKPGTFVRVTLDLAPLTNGLVVPSDAVRVTKEGTVVVRAVTPEPDPVAPAQPGGPPQLVAELVPVRVLGSEGGATTVESLGAPLAAGDRVVVTGVDLAFPGAPLFPRIKDVPESDPESQPERAP